MIKQHADLKLIEKLQILNKMDDLQREPKALKFVINQKALVTIIARSPN